MATKPRDFNPQLYYHIFNRTVRETRNLFRTKEDYQRFLSTLDYYRYHRKLRYSQFITLHYLHPKGVNDGGVNGLRIKLIAYALMPSHFHLLVKPLNPTEVGRFIADLSNSYTRYFNTKYKRLGVMLQGTFKAKEIKGESSLLQVSRYIHLNPIFSAKVNPKGLLKKPQDWPYSSYHEWSGFKNPHLTDQEEVNFWTTKTGGPLGYREFVEAKIGQDPAQGIEDLVLE